MVRKSNVAGLMPRTEPSDMATLMILPAWKLPGRPQPKPRPAELKSQFPLSCRGQTPKVDHQTELDQVSMVQPPPSVSANPPALSANMMVFEVPSPIASNLVFEL